jgi:hypothetical protein
MEVLDVCPIVLAMPLQDTFPLHHHLWIVPVCNSFSLEDFLAVTLVWIKFDFIVAVCGNGIVELGEECDGTTGCNSTCFCAPPYEPNPVLPQRVCRLSKLLIICICIYVCNFFSHLWWNYDLFDSQMGLVKWMVNVKWMGTSMRYVTGQVLTEECVLVGLSVTVLRLECIVLVVCDNCVWMWNNLKILNFQNLMSFNKTQLIDFVV